MRRKFLAQIIPLAAILAVTGCASVNSTERAQTMGHRQTVADKRIITDPSLHRRVRIMAVNENYSPEGFLKIQVELLNTTRAVQDFNYRIEWFDSTGMQIQSAAGAYIPRQIEGRESTFITAMSPTTAAKDFRLQLIENVR